MQKDHIKYQTDEFSELIGKKIRDKKDGEVYEVLAVTQTTIEFESGYIYKEDFKKADYEILKVPKIKNKGR